MSDCLPHFFFPTPICAPKTLLPKTKLLLLSCQCCCKGDKCNNISVRLDFPVTAFVPPREF